MPTIIYEKHDITLARSGGGSLLLTAPECQKIIDGEEALKMQDDIADIQAAGLSVYAYLSKFIARSKAA